MISTGRLVVGGSPWVGDVVREVNAAVVRGTYCFYVPDPSHLEDVVRVVGARRRRGVNEFRRLNDGRWMAAQGDWHISVER
jgi:hypothetical protein